MKPLMLILFLFSLTSCFTQRSITKSKEPISDSVLASMKQGKIYDFHFSDGYIYKVKVEKITGDTVFGTTSSVYHKDIWRGENPKVDKVMDEKEQAYFAYGFNEIEQKTNKITMRQFSPVLTAIPVGLVAVSVIALINLDPL
jgi:hypothetical protein